MQQRQLILYGAIALATPLLVLANALLSSADHALLPPATPLRPLGAKLTPLEAASQTLDMAPCLWIKQPQARIVRNPTPD